MKENMEATEKLITEESKEQEQEQGPDFFKQNQQLYKSKICSEVVQNPMLSQKSQALCSLPNQKIVLSIFVLIFVIAGLIFRIGNNEGYKAYKEIIENEINILEMNGTFPNENETLKLMAYFKRDKNEDSFCTYLKYSLYICSEKYYRSYCNITKYNEKKCNYMDRQYFLGYEFICDEDNYKNGFCDEIQYNDYLYNFNPYERKIKDFFSQNGIEINITGSFIFEKMWCSIGNYDFKIYLSFLIFLGIFILFLIYNIIMVKKNLQPGINYYIIISCHMFYYVIFRIYIPIFWILFSYSTIVTLYQVNISNFYRDSLDPEDPFFKPDLEIIFPEQKLWKEKRIYAIIFCGITLALSIMVIFLARLNVIINNYLSFKFDGKNSNSEVIRKASIKVGNNRYNFGLKQNRILYLNENRKNMSYYFMEILFEDNTYYLKCNNLYLKDQLNWADITNPENNLLFKKLLRVLNLILIFLILFIFSHFIIKNDNNSQYYQHLLDLGFEPKLNTPIRICFYLNSIFFNLILITSIILVLLVITSLYLRAIFGGFANTIILKLKIYFAYIISIVIFALFLVSTGGCALNITFFWTYMADKEIKFTNSKLMSRNMILFLLCKFLAIIFMITFITWIKIIPHLKKIRSEKSKLSSSKSKLEDEFMYISTDNTNYILEAIEKNNLPKHLFYTRKINQNPIKIVALNSENSGNLGQVSPNISNIVYCLETVKEIAIDDKEEIDIQKYNYKEFRILKEIRNNIIITSGILILTIISYILSFKNNKYYNEYRDYLMEIDKNYKKILNEVNDALKELNPESVLSSYTKFWCKVGIYEKSVLISLIVFLALYLLFLIISILIHKNHLFKLNYNNGESILYKNLIVINSTICIIIIIYMYLLLFLFIYTFVVSIWAPEKNIFFDESWAEKNLEINDLEKNWTNNKMKHFLNIPIQFLITYLLFLFTKNIYLILDYLNMNYQENDEEEENIYEKRKKIELNEKRTCIMINNVNYNVRIKLNDVLYLTGYENNKIYKFKKILIENITNTFVYVRIGVNTITDQISHAEWDYPNINNYFLQLLKISLLILPQALMLIPLLDLNLQNDLTYWLISTNYKIISIIFLIKEIDMDTPFFFDVFSIYGKTQYIYTIVRLIFYLIYSCIFFIILIKRMLSGGFKNLTETNKAYIFQIILLVLISIFILGDFIIILLGIFSLICYNKYFNSLQKNNIKVMIYFQLIVIIAMVSSNIRIFIKNRKLLIYIEKLKNAMVCFNQRVDYLDEGDMNYKPVEFKFISLEGNSCSIKECIHPYLQRYLYYYEDNKNNKIADNISDGGNNEIINIKVNDINNNIISNNIEENKNILDDNSNKIEIEMQKAVSDDSNN